MGPPEVRPAPRASTRTTQELIHETPSETTPAKLNESLLSFCSSSGTSCSPSVGTFFMLADDFSTSDADTIRVGWGAGSIV